MKGVFLKILFGVIFMVSTISVAAEDRRIMVELPAHMKGHMLENMRGHLLVVNQLLLLLSEERFDEAADLAEEELGMSSLSKHGANHIAPLYPEGMRAVGTQMHKSASQFSRVAQEGDLADSIKALGKVISSCTACHAAYKVN